VKTTILLLAVAGLLSAVTPVFAGGWYLIGPWPEKNHTLLGLPLSVWPHLESFDTAQACQDELSKMRDTDLCTDPDPVIRNKARENGLCPGEVRDGVSYEDFTWSLQNAQCIASDDPRLAR
jgi:hypothetical protein